MLRLNALTSRIYSKFNTKFGLTGQLLPAGLLPGVNHSLSRVLLHPAKLRRRSVVRALEAQTVSRTGGICLRQQRV